MNGYLRQSTASQSRLIGPFVSDTDFKTAQTGLTIANTDIKLRANGTTLSNKNSGGGTHQANGAYSVTWDATDTANVGELFFIVSVSGALLVWGVYTVLEEAAYDAMFAASAPGYVVDQPVNATKIGGTTQTGRDIGASVLLAADQAVNTTKFGGTTVTGRDIGASVLLSSGSGTGQLDFTSGVVKANLAQILGTALTETAGQIAAAFKKFFDKATPTGTINSLPDAVAGAASGLALVGSNVGAATSVTGAVGSVTADVGITQAGADKVWGSTTRTLTAFSTALALSVWDVLTANIGTASSIGLKLKNWVLGSDNKSLLSTDSQAGVTIPTVTTLTNAPSDSSGVTTLLSRLSSLRAGYLDNLSAGAAALESSLQALITTVGASAAGIASAVWSAATRLLTAGTNIVLAKGTGVTGFNDLSAAAVNAEADQALADYDGPTHAEMTSELGDLPTAPEIVEAMFLQDSGQTYAGAVSGSVVKEIADNAGGTLDIPTPSEIALAVRNNLLGSRDANILFLEAGGASTGGLELYDIVSGSPPTIDTTIKPSGAFSSIKLVNSANYIGRVIAGFDAGRISFYFYTEALPAVDNEPFILFEDNLFEPDRSADFRLGPDGLIHFQPIGFPETAGTRVLSPETWYRVSIAFNNNGTTDDLDVNVYVDGLLDISVRAQSTDGVNTGLFRFFGPAGSDGGPFYIAHIYVDDDPNLTDTSDVRCTAKFPTTANDDEFDTTGGTGAVSERPLDEANYRQQAGSTQARQNYTLQAASEGDTDISSKTIIGVMGWVRVKKSTPFGGAGTPAITIDGVDYSIAASITTSPSTIIKPVNQLTYPDDPAGIGMVSGGTSVDFFLYELGVVIAYIDPIIPTAEAIADRVWEDDNSVRTTAGSAGNKLRQGLILYEGS